MSEFVFWHIMVSPHMTGLVKALASQGHKVTYVASQLVLADRATQGWDLPDIQGVRLELVKSLIDACSLADSFSSDVVHLTEGVRGNGYISGIIHFLATRHLQWGSIMETVDERFGTGHIKRLVYRWVLGKADSQPDFVLAIGSVMPAWIAARGFPKGRIFPFAYFLPPSSLAVTSSKGVKTKIRIGFIGRLIPLKRLDLLIHALAKLDRTDYELFVVGDGPLKNQITQLANKMLGYDRIHMHGQVSMTEARRLVESFDCLVLPSDADGWGAVISEALMVGTPAICSDACGSSVAVNASGVGGVFKSGNVLSLKKLLSDTIDAGRNSIEKRQEIYHWAQCLSSEAGAIYLNKVINSVYKGAPRPKTTWESSRNLVE